MTYQDFLASLPARWKAIPSERLGQSCMNQLYSVRPDLHKLIMDMSVSTNASPYYENKNLDAFNEVIVRNW